jgi:hypothetical protein
MERLPLGLGRDAGAAHARWTGVSGAVLVDPSAARDRRRPRWWRDSRPISETCRAAAKASRRWASTGSRPSLRPRRHRGRGVAVREVAGQVLAGKDHARSGLLSASARCLVAGCGWWRRRRAASRRATRRAALAGGVAHAEDQESHLKRSTAQRAASATAGSGSSASQFRRGPSQPFRSRSSRWHRARCGRTGRARCA